MIDNTKPKEYKIATLHDFLKVPPDRLDECLVDFKSFLEFADVFGELAEACGEIAGLEGDEAKELVKIPSFTWVDDGENNASINIQY